MDKDEVQVDYEIDEEETPQPKSEPKEMKPTTLFVEGFIKPFSVDEVLELVSKMASPINYEEHFFMNTIKSFCYVTYASMEDAKKAKEDIDGKQFPEKFGNKLRVRFTSITAASMKRDNPSAKQESAESEKRQRVEKIREKEELISLDVLFRKTRAKPVIFYKPLTEEERETKRT